MAIGLLLVVVVANLVAFQYVRAALSLAVDEGARHGAALGRDPAACEAYAEETLQGEAGLLRGPLGERSTVHCAVEAGPDSAVLVARATATLRWWVPGIPDATIAIEGRSVVEALT